MPYSWNPCQPVPFDAISSSPPAPSTAREFQSFFASSAMERQNSTPWLAGYLQGLSRARVGGWAKQDGKRFCMQKKEENAFGETARLTAHRHGKQKVLKQKHTAMRKSGGESTCVRNARRWQTCVRRRRKRGFVICGCCYYNARFFCATKGWKWKKTRLLFGRPWAEAGRKKTWEALCRR